MDQKKKRPDKPTYQIPAKRNNPENKYNQTEYAEDDYTNEVTNNRQACSSRSSVSWGASLSKDWRQVISSSSSSSPCSRSVSGESCKDDSSDFEESCREATSDEEISVRMNKTNLDDHLNKKPRAKPSHGNHNIEADSYRTNTKVPNRMRHKGYSSAKQDANQLQSSDSSETEPERGLFGNYGDSSISDIDASSNSHRKKERVLTSTPYSDIVEEKVLETAKYVPEESGTESTLLDENDIRETTINTNRSKHGNSFEIYHDPSFILDEPKGYSEIFGNNFIPCPVQPVFALPPIHRLSAPVSSTQGVTVLNRMSPEKVIQRPAQLQYPPPLLPLQQHPRPLLQQHPWPLLQDQQPLLQQHERPLLQQDQRPLLQQDQRPLLQHERPLLQQQHQRPLFLLQHPPLHRQNDHLHSDYIPPSLSILSKPPIMPPVPRHVSLPWLQPVPVANLPRAFSRPTATVQRFNSPSSLRAASNLQYLQKGTLNPGGAESHIKDDSAFKAPPVARPQQMNSSHPIRNPNQCETTQRRLPYSYSSRNKVIYDEDLWPDD